MPKKIILDTNILLYIGKYKLDIFAELNRVCDFSYKVYVLDGTIQELENLINKGSLSVKRFAELALRIIKAKKVNIIGTAKDKSVDKTLLDLPADNIIVVSQDKELKEGLTKKGIKVLSLRQKRLIYEG